MKQNTTFSTLLNQRPVRTGFSSDVMNTPNLSSSARKQPYHKPTLIKYGSLAQLTQSGTGSKNEAFRNPGKGGGCEVDLLKRPCAG